MKVKLIEVETDESELEKKINRFIRGKNITDIKLLITSVDTGVRIFAVYTALILYEE